LKYAFGVIGPVDEIPAIKNILWFLGNQSIRHKTLLPSEVTNLESIDHFDGLVIWTKEGYSYNATAIKQFAQTHIVISHVWDFCNVLYPSLSASTELLYTSTVTYVRDWGNFRANDLAEMREGTGFGSGTLITVKAVDLSTYGNVTQIARCDSNRVAFFHMHGRQPKSGFYVMDLQATTPSSEWTGIWHLFPAIKMVKDFPTGKYARWMGNGTSMWNLNWINNHITALVNENSDIAEKWVIGRSVQNRDINAITIGSGSRYVIIDGCIHGNEKTTAFACLRLAELLIEYYRSSSSWHTKLTQYKVIIIPVLNPDGYAANTRENANGVDLNRNFPPAGSGSEPETKALIALMGDYTPTIYINMHEGGSYYPVDVLYGYYEVDPFVTFTRENIRQANNTFTALQHWGWYGSAWIGTLRDFYRSGLTSSAQAYASWKYDASTILIESFLWSPTYGAKKSLWGLDYYCSLSISLLKHYDYDESFMVRSDAFITETSGEPNGILVDLDASEMTHSSTTVICDTIDRGNPVTIRIDDIARSEGDGWTYEANVVTVKGANNRIEIEGKYNHIISDSETSLIEKRLVLGPFSAKHVTT